MIPGDIDALAAGRHAVLRQPMRQGRWRGQNCKSGSVPGRLEAGGETHGRHPELCQPGDTDRPHHRCRRRPGHRLFLHHRNRRIVGAGLAERPFVPAIDRPPRPRKSKRSGASCSSTPMPPRSAPSPRSRWRRSIPRCGTCAAVAPNCRYGGWRAARKNAVPLYSTEGGWLHIETAALVDDALAVKAKGFPAPRSRSDARMSPRMSRACAPSAMPSAPALKS